MEDCTSEEIIQQIEYGYYNFVISKKWSGKHLSDKGQENTAELEAEIRRQRRTKNDTLNSILGALQFTPSKQQRVVRMRKRLLEAGVRHQKGGNKKERTLALIGSVCLTIAILLYVVYAIFASPQMKFKIYEMFSI